MKKENKKDLLTLFLSVLFTGVFCLLSSSSVFSQELPKKEDDTTEQSIIFNDTDSAEKKTEKIEKKVEAPLVKKEIPFVKKEPPKPVLTLMDVSDKGLIESRIPGQKIQQQNQVKADLSVSNNQNKNINDNIQPGSSVPDEKPAASKKQSKRDWFAKGALVLLVVFLVVLYRMKHSKRRRRVFRNSKR